MAMQPHEKRTYIFLLILTVFSTIVFQLWRALFNNFSVDVINLNSAAVGLIQTTREIPGFMAFLVIYITLVIKEKWIAFFSVLLMTSGIAITGFFPSQWGLLSTTLLMSIGFHYFETINQSLSMQYFSKANYSGATANLRKYAALAAIACGLVIIPLTTTLSYKALYFSFGIFGLLGAFYALRYLPDETKVPIQKKKLVFKKKYRLFYALTFLNGARRQIFTVFALFLLVKRHDMSATTISALFVVNNLISFFFYPYVAKLIKRWGEKITLQMEYVSLIAIFSLYALVNYPWAALTLYLLDNLFFAFSIATKSYFQKIADPSDLAPTASVSFTINHIAAVIIPFFGGLLWLIDWRIPFLMGAGIATISLVLSRYVNTIAHEPS